MNANALPRSPLFIAAVQLGLLVLGIYYTFIGGQTAQGIFDHRWRLITLWLNATLFGSWLLWHALRRQPLPRTPLDVPLLLLLIAWLLATLFSTNPIYSREALVFFITYLFFFYMAAGLGRRRWWVELTFNAIIAVSGLVWMLALLQLSWWYQDLSAVGLAVDRPPPRLSVLGNPNTMAGFIALVLPLVLYKIVAARYGVTRLLLAGWAGMLLGSAVLTQSRGGLLGLVVAVTAFFLLSWQAKRPKASPEGGAVRLRLENRVRPRWRGWLGFGLIAVLLAGVVVIALLSRSLDRAVSDRQQVMAGALKTLAAHPLSGSGPGTLGDALIRYQQPLDTIWSDAHNLPLTLAAETGLPGLLALLALAWAGLSVLRQTWASHDSRLSNRAGLAALAALLGFITHNLVDSMFKFPLMMILVALLAGIWLSPFTRAGGRLGWMYSVLGAAMTALVAITYLGINDVQNIAANNQAVAAAGQEDWEQALVSLERAQALTPNLPFYHRQLGLVAGQLAAEEAGYRVQAIDHFQQAFRGLEPLPADQANLACLYWENGQPAEALQAMRTAAETAPDVPIYALNLGYYLEESGDVAAARALYTRVLLAQPEALRASFWTRTEPRANLLPNLVAQAAHAVAASGASSLNLAQLHYHAGDFEHALQTYDEIVAGQSSAQVDARLGRAKTLFAMGRLDHAYAELQTVLILQPRLSETHLYLSKIALARPELTAAGRAARLALLFDKNGETLFQAGLVAEAQGDAVRALEYYEAAFRQTVTRTDLDLSRYATEVARRRPLPVTYLPCLIQLYPGDLLTGIARAQSALLERQGDHDRAQQIYERLQVFEPAAAPF